MYLKLLLSTLRHKGSLPINKTMTLALGAIVTVVVLGILLSTMTDLEGIGACSPGVRPLASTMADMTGNDMC